MPQSSNQKGGHKAKEFPVHEALALGAALALRTAQTKTMSASVRTTCAQQLHALGLIVTPYRSSDINTFFVGALFGKMPDEQLTPAIRYYMGHGNPDLSERRRRTVHFVRQILLRWVLLYGAALRTPLTTYEVLIKFAEEVPPAPSSPPRMSTASVLSPTGPPSHHPRLLTAECARAGGADGLYSAECSPRWMVGAQDQGHFRREPLQRGQH